VKLPFEFSDLSAEFGCQVVGLLSVESRALRLAAKKLLPE
jgi:hypothetical protein